MSSEEVSSEVSEAEISDSTQAESSEGESIESEESEELSEESIEEPAELAAEEVAPKMFKTIINGREELITEAEAIKGYQRAKASNEVFSKASEERKAAQAIRDGMKSDPKQALLDLGMTMEEVQEAFYNQTKKFLDLSEETDEQRYSREREEELEAFRQDKLDREEAMKSDNEKSEATRFETEIEAEFTGALEAGNIPSSPGAISRIAQIQIMNLQKGYDLSVDEAAEIYQEERREDIDKMFEGMSEEQMMQWVGPDRMKAIRNYDLQKVRGPKAKKEDSPRAPREKQDRRSAKDFFS